MFSPRVDAKKFGSSLEINSSGVASASRGLVGDTVFAVIPNIQPVHTFIITAGFQSVRHFVLDFLTYTLKYGQDIPCQAVAYTDVQVILNCIDLVRLHIVYVWLACT